MTGSDRNPWRRFLALPNESRAKTVIVAFLVSSVCAVLVSGATVVAARVFRALRREQVLPAEGSDLDLVPPRRCAAWSSRMLRSSGTACSGRSMRAISSPAISCFSKPATAFRPM